MRRLSHLALNEEGFVFDPMTGDSYQVSLTGLFVLKALRDGLDEEQIAAQMSEEYEVTPEEASRDVADFVGQLRVLGLM